MSIGGKLRTNTTIKPRLSNTLKNWLPILQSGANEIEEVLNDFAKENPVLGFSFLMFDLKRFQKQEYYLKYQQI